MSDPEREVCKEPKEQGGLGAHRGMCAEIVGAKDHTTPRRAEPSPKPGDTSLSPWATRTLDQCRGGKMQGAPVIHDQQQEKKKKSISMYALCIHERYPGKRSKTAPNGPSHPLKYDLQWKIKMWRGLGVGAIRRKMRRGNKGHVDKTPWKKWSLAIALFLVWEGT